MSSKKQITCYERYIFYSDVKSFQASQCSFSHCYNVQCVHLVCYLTVQYIFDLKQDLDLAKQKALNLCIFQM